jgi:hypothetical protein
MRIPNHVVYSKSDIKSLVSYFKGIEGKYSTYGMLFEAALTDAIPILNLRGTSSRDVAKACSVIAMVVADEATRGTTLRTTAPANHRCDIVYKTIYRNIRRVLYVLFFEEVDRLPTLLSSVDPYDPTPYVATWRFSRNNE